jgi:hypothetical protein
VQNDLVQTAGHPDADKDRRPQLECPLHGTTS